MVAAPAAFALAFLHARRAFGGRRAALELFALAAYGYALEAVAIQAFGSHTYGRAWALAPLGVPIAVALVWSALISSAMALAARCGWRGAGAGLAAAAVALSLDVLMEPVAVRSGLWRWTPPGPWLDVPVGNFVGWAVIVAVYAGGAARFARSGPSWHEAGVRVALAAASILALVGVGLSWKFLRLEWWFVGARGWVAFSLILLAAIVVAVARRRAGADVGDDDGMLGELARPSSVRPSAVFLGLAAVFALDAAALGDPRLFLVAASSLLTLAWVSGRASSGS